jgi:hypothetical protein
LPAVGIALAAVAAVVFIGGTLLSLLTAGDGEPPEPAERPTLEALMADTDLVVEGTAEVVRRLGEPRDPGVVVLIRLDDVVVPAGVELDEVLIYDKGFREDWGEGQEVLLFLRGEDDLPQGAKFRVRERCILQTPGALECPYEMPDIERLGRDA